MKTDIIIDYDELTKDKTVNILIMNVEAGEFQLWVVDTLLRILNIVSPVKFNVAIEAK